MNIRENPIMQTGQHYENRSLARRSADTGFAHFLGLASLAIGLTELLAPRKVERMLGLNGPQSSKDRQGAIRVLGVREIGQGISILAGGLSLASLRTGVWGRVLGDGLDTALLAAAAKKKPKTPRSLRSPRPW